MQETDVTASKKVAFGIRPGGRVQGEDIDHWGVTVRSSWLRLYAPFLVLALVQGLFIAVAPSRGGGDAGLATFGAAPVDQAGAGGFSAPGNTPGAFGAAPGSTPSAGATPSAGGSSVGGIGTSGGGGATTPAAAAPVGPGAAGGNGEGAVPAPGTAGATGDTSHCTEDGRQFGITRRGGPPCVAAWPDGADNGGATYTGVTAETIKVVYFSSEPNEQVNAVLAPQGLATSEEEFLEALGAYVEFLNAKYELYGRQVVVERVVGDCPTSPPDFDACIAAAQEVVKMQPFAVVWNTSLYDAVFDVWARNGIVTLGGNHFDERYFTQRRPFRYDYAMSGTQSADHISEYYCKKMAGQPASHAGRVIHPTIGGRETVRKLAVVTPEIEANVLNAQRVQAAVAACGGGDVPILTYESDIERGAEQTRAVVAKLIDEKATTVACMCDPIAPAFLTKGLSGNRYVPEYLIPGLGLIDYDKLGRLYDSEIMAHAFGPSHLGLNQPLDDADSARVWQATGREGHPCGQNGCGTTWEQIWLLGLGLQGAGPNLNPLSFEQGVLSFPGSGGTPDLPLYAFGQGDYTALSDAKEVYWSNTAPSSIDGQPGSYVPVAGGKRHQLGQWPGGLDQIPVPAS